MDTGLNWQGKTHPPLDVEAATAKFRAGETSQIFSGKEDGDSVTRYDALRVESTAPCQDHLSYRVVDVGMDQPWQFWGVYDGHA